MSPHEGSNWLRIEHLFWGEERRFILHDLLRFKPPIHGLWVELSTTELFDFEMKKETMHETYLSHTERFFSTTSSVSSLISEVHVSFLKGEGKGAGNFHYSERGEQKEEF